jgi:hypothetical protein
MVIRSTPPNIQLRAVPLNQALRLAGAVVLLTEPRDALVIAARSVLVSGTVVGHGDTLRLHLAQLDPGRWLLRIIGPESARLHGFENNYHSWLNRLKEHLTSVFDDESEGPTSMLSPDI